MSEDGGSMAGRRVRGSLAGPRMAGEARLRKLIAVWAMVLATATVVLLGLLAYELWDIRHSEATVANQQIRIGNSIDHIDANTPTSKDVQDVTSQVGNVDSTLTHMEGCLSAIAHQTTFTLTC
jgi:hypothetical protein